MTVVACAVLSGVMFYLSQGVNDVWWLAWFAPAPLLWLAYGPSRQFPLFLASLAASAAGLIYAWQCYGGSLFISAPTVVLPLFINAPLFALCILFARFVYRRTPAMAAVFSFPACWTGVEYLISLVSPHGSYGSLAYSQMSMPVLIQIASVFGYLSVSFLLCLFSNGLAVIARRKSGSAVAGGVAISICVLNIAFGAAKLQAPQTGAVRVAAFADDAARDRWSRYRPDAPRTPAQRASDYAAYTTEIEQAVRAAATDGVRLVVLPEEAVIGGPPWGQGFLAPLARATGARIVAGVFHPEPAEDLAVTYSPDGAVHAYSKRHLIPILEAQYKPAKSSGLLGDGVATAICKDMDFPDTIRSDARSGTIRLMAVPAGDFRFDDWIHGRIAIMRGVENGFSIVRSAEDGLLTATDAQGRQLARVSTAKPGMASIVANIPLGTGATLYTRIGDIFAWLSLAFALAVGVMALASRNLSADRCFPVR